MRKNIPRRAKKERGRAARRKKWIWRRGRGRMSRKNRIFAPESPMQKAPRGGHGGFRTEIEIDRRRLLAFVFHTSKTSQTFEFPGRRAATGDVLVVCISVHPGLETTRRKDVIHIGVGFLRCSFSEMGNAKALKCGTSKGKIPTLFLLYSYYYS